MQGSENLNRQEDLQTPTPGFSSDWRFWGRDLLFALGIALVVILFFYQPVKVEGNSMAPWLSDQERIFINKFVYKFEDIQRGDIVVFWYPLDPSKSFIKRVVGLPGETVEISRGRVFINGQYMPEPYVPATFADDQNAGTVRVPPGSYFVLGDHRISSNDSRSWGTVDRKYIYGKAVFAYWPVSRFGTIEAAEK